MVMWEGREWQPRWLPNDAKGKRDGRRIMLEGNQDGWQLMREGRQDQASVHLTLLATLVKLFIFSTDKRTMRIPVKQFM